MKATWLRGMLAAAWQGLASGVKATRPRTLLAAAALGLAACAPPGPRPLVYGGETCTQCSMTISDKRFGAELVSRRGKVRAFDSIECLAGYVAAHPGEKGATAWVTDVTRPGRLIAAERAAYVRLVGVASPMGRGLAALDPGRPGERARAGLGGPTLTWSQVLAQATKEGS